MSIFWGQMFSSRLRASVLSQNLTQGKASKKMWWCVLPTSKHTWITWFRPLAPPHTQPSLQLSQSTSTNSFLLFLVNGWKRVTLTTFADILKTGQSYKLNMLYLRVNFCLEALTVQLNREFIILLGDVRVEVLCLISELRLIHSLSMGPHDNGTVD